MDEYAETIKDWITQAPIVVFSDTKTRWVADGFHRVLAAREAKLYAVPAILHHGTRRDALLFAVGANRTHGLRRSNADKRRAVETLLRDPEWGQWSDRMIAERVGVSHPFVGKLRAHVVTVTTCERPADPEPSPPRADQLEKFTSCERPAEPEPSAHVVTVTTCERPADAEPSAPRASQAATVATCESPTSQPSPPQPATRMGRDGKAYPAPAPKPAPAVAPPPRKEPAPKGPTAADAMRACIRVTGALAELEKLDGVLLPDEPALPPMVAELRKALDRYAPMVRRGGPDA